jgi:caa(3)-type oxidase subunit IV
LIFGLLLTLTLVTVEVAFVDLGRGNTMALTIAVTKALLVILYFACPIQSQTHATRDFQWLPLALVLIGITAGDYLSRGWLPFRKVRPDAPQRPEKQTTG